MGEDVLMMLHGILMNPFVKLVVQCKTLFMIGCLTISISASFMLCFWGFSFYLSHSLWSQLELSTGDVQLKVNFHFFFLPTLNYNNSLEQHRSDRKWSR